MRARAALALLLFASCGDRTDQHLYDRIAEIDVEIATLKDRVRFLEDRAGVTVNDRTSVAWFRKTCIEDARGRTDVVAQIALCNRIWSQ